MKRPVFSFNAEILTDAPFEHIRERVLAVGPEGFTSLRAITNWDVPEVFNDRLVLHWFRRVGGAKESGELTLRPDPKGAHLRLEGRLSGWAGFLLLGLLRWRTDRLLDRFVEEL